jgi:hypothetical protein
MTIIYENFLDGDQNIAASRLTTRLQQLTILFSGKFQLTVQIVNGPRPDAPNDADSQK